MTDLMTTRAPATRDRADLAASILFGAVRVGLGLLWLHEGYVKLRAHFGSADILLVVDGASANSRVPEYFRFVAEHLLRPTAHLAGVVTPLTEVALGLVLVLGVFSMLSATASAGLLAVYWSSDQLIAQYPVMALLSVGVIVGQGYSSHWSIMTLVHRRPDREEKA
jgi:thiosulfate dehydrogenase [quinone] large subunit